MFFVLFYVIFTLTQTSIHPPHICHSWRAGPTFLLGAGNSCSQRALISIPQSLGTLKQVWLISLAVDWPPVEFDYAWTNQRNCTCTTWDPGGESVIKCVTFTLIFYSCNWYQAGNPGSSDKRCWLRGLICLQKSNACQLYVYSYNWRLEEIL